MSWYSQESTHLRAVGQRDGMTIPPYFPLTNYNVPILSLHRPLHAPAHDQPARPVADMHILFLHAGHVERYKHLFCKNTGSSPFDLNQPHVSRKQANRLRSRFYRQGIPGSSRWSTQARLVGATGHTGGGRKGLPRSSLRHTLLCLWWLLHLRLRGLRLLGWRLRQRQGTLKRLDLRR